MEHNDFYFFHFVENYGGIFVNNPLKSLTYGGGTVFDAAIIMTIMVPQLIVVDALARTAILFKTHNDTYRKTSNLAPPCLFKKSP